MWIIKFARLERANTGSYITYELPQAMGVEEACVWFAQHMPGWEFVSGCPQNPDMLSGDDPVEV